VLKVLILSVTTGQGHNTTAAAISTYLEALGAECRVLDTYGYLSRLLGKTVAQGYLFSVENAKTIYSTIYKKLEHRKKNKSKLSATRLWNLMLKKKLKGYIDIYDPDVIVMTHVFAATIVDIMIQHNTLRAKTVGIVTDFSLHPYWEEVPSLDYLVVANEYMLQMAKKKGFSEKQILPLGIPIHPKFSKRMSKQEARRAIGLDESKSTILMMGGSMGYGDPKENIISLDKLPLDFQIINVCGANVKAKEDIDNLTTEKTVLNYGYTSNIDVLMDAADCIIGKPGGLTTSESLAKELPMIIVNPIPGQEERNVQFLLNIGAAMAVTDLVSIEDIVTDLFSNPEKIEVMRNAIKLISKPNSTKDICEFVMGLEEQK
jgi:processive 1,2-diacylglycerol beta-glucosyltransferase